MDPRGISGGWLATSEKQLLSTKIPKSRNVFVVCSAESTTGPRNFSPHKLLWCLRTATHSNTNYEVIPWGPTLCGLAKTELTPSLVPRGGSHLLLHRGRTKNGSVGTEQNWEDALCIGDNQTLLLLIPSAQQK